MTGRKAVDVAVEHGGNLIDMTCIDNLVDAVVLALDADDASGRAYSITNGEPVRIRGVIDRFAGALALPRPRGRVPLALARCVAHLHERAHRTFSPHREPRVLRCGVQLLALDMTLDISRARNALAYAPRVDMATALARTFAGMAHEAAA